MRKDPQSELLLLLLLLRLLLPLPLEWVRQVLGAAASSLLGLLPSSASACVRPVRICNTLHVNVSNLFGTDVVNSKNDVQAQTDTSTTANHGSKSSSRAPLATCATFWC